MWKSLWFVKMPVVEDMDRYKMKQSEIYKKTENYIQKFKLVYKYKVRFNFRVNFILLAENEPKWNIE